MHIINSFHASRPRYAWRTLSLILAPSPNSNPNPNPNPNAFGSRRAWIQIRMQMLQFESKDTPCRADVHTRRPVERYPNPNPNPNQHATNHFEPRSNEWVHFLLIQKRWLEAAVSLVVRRRQDEERGVQERREHGACKVYPY